MRDAYFPFQDHTRSAYSAKDRMLRLAVVYIELPLAEKRRQPGALCPMQANASRLKPRKVYRTQTLLLRSPSLPFPPTRMNQTPHSGRFSEKACVSPSPFSARDKNLPAVRGKTSRNVPPGDVSLSRRSRLVLWSSRLEKGKNTQRRRRRPLASRRMHPLVETTKQRIAHHRRFGFVAKVLVIHRRIRRETAGVLYLRPTPKSNMRQAPYFPTAGHTIEVNSGSRCRAASWDDS